MTNSIVFKPLSFFSTKLTLEGDKKRKPSSKKSKHNLLETNNQMVNYDYSNNQITEGNITYWHNTPL